MARVGGWVVLLITGAVLASLIENIDAQVTFSRDWNAGKRGPLLQQETATNDCRASVRSAAALCRMLLVSKPTVFKLFR